MTSDENWQLLGHAWAENLLKNHLSNNRIRHAYLFTGPQGVGRRTLALRLIKAINCTQPTASGYPCLICRSCKLIEKVQHPDLTVVQADKVGGILKVDQIRELQHTLSLTPYEANYRVALILRFEEANPNAANALLKTLEEPESRVILMLTAQDSESLLPTIVSRCEVLRLRPLSLDDLSKGLQDQFGSNPEEAVLYAHISEGRPGRALRLLQDPGMMEKRQTCLEDLVRLIPAGKIERFDFAEMLVKDKDFLSFLLQVWSSFWRDIYLTLSGSSVQITNLDWKNEIDSVGNNISFSEAVAMVKLLQETSHLLKRNVNPRLTLEVLMLEMPHCPVLLSTINNPIKS